MRAKKRIPWFRRFLLVAVAGLAGWLFFSFWTLPDARSLASRNPGTTALMQARVLEGKEQGKKLILRQKWVDYSAISKTAIDAVVLSEDASFFLHQGIDYEELQNVLWESFRRRRIVRGASTITQQLAKNLWLSNERSLFRKAKELMLAKRLEESLSKKRILTLYLNVAEWGDGIFGIEAAARSYFGVGSKEVSLAQAVMLASMLPSPRRWTPLRRPPILLNRSTRLIERLAQARKISADQAVAGTADLERLFQKLPAEEQPEDNGNEDDT